MENAWVGPLPLTDGGPGEAAISFPADGGLVREVTSASRTTTLLPRPRRCH